MADLGAEASANGDQEVLDQICTALQERPHLAFPVAQWMIPNLTLAPSSAVTGVGARRFVGKITFTHPTQGFSFISSPEIKEEFGIDIFLHTAQRGNFQINDHVSFAILLNKDGKPQAFDLTTAASKGKVTVPAIISSPTVSGNGWQGMSGMGGKGGLLGPSAKGGMGGKVGLLGPAAKGGKGGLLGLGAAKGSNGGVGGISAKGGKSGIDGQRYTGKISAWTPGGKYGFVQCDETFAIYGMDCWAHSAQIGDFKQDDVVSFELTLNKQGNPQAINLQWPGTESPGTVAPRTVPPKWVDDSATSGRYEGTISRWTPGGKYGFLKCDDTFAVYGMDVWVHSAQIGDFVSGDVVTFTLTHNKEGSPQGIDLLPAGSSGKRARILQSDEDALV